MHGQTITSPHVTDVIPCTLVYLECTNGWTIRMIDVALSLGVIA